LVGFSAFLLVAGFVVADMAVVLVAMLPAGAVTDMAVAPTAVVPLVDAAVAPAGILPAALPADTAVVPEAVPQVDTAADTVDPVGLP